MNNDAFRCAYDILSKIYRDGAYLSVELSGITNKRVTKLVYGVTERHYELNYIVDVLSPKGIKPSVRPALLLGAVSLLYLGTPLNVVLNEMDGLLEEVGKSGVKNFVHAVMSKIDRREYSLPAKSNTQYLSVKYNLPSSLVGLYRKEYPDTFEDIIFAKDFSLTHIRLNERTTKAEILQADKDAIATETGFFVKNTREISLLNFEGKLTYMSYSSTLVAESIVRKGIKGNMLLDCCAAPGGKSLYLAQCGWNVTAADIHQHRVQLIESYAARMKGNITTVLQDGTVYREDWEQKFDAILCDVPCSGLGVVGRKKDIAFNRTYDDVVALSRLQFAILENCAKYVKKGGLLVYSTCTVFRMENGDVIEKFLKANSDFRLEKIDLPFENEGQIQFLPDGKGMEGFYLCHMRKI